MERKEIVKKVCTLYKTYGIKSITMDDAARHLGISKKTLYQFFSDKSQMVKEAIAVEIETKQQNFSALSDQALNAIEELLVYYKIQIKMILDYKPNFIYDLKKYYPDIYNNYVTIKRQKILESVEQNLKKGIKEGFFRADLDVSVISRLTLMRIEGMIYSGLFTIEEMMSPEVFTGIFYYHVYGIVTDKGRKYFENHKKQLTFR
jgi:AcrR family transcriptional regulator